MPTVTFPLAHSYRTPEMEREIVAMMLGGESASHAAVRCGVMPDELRSWRGDEPAFAARLEDAERAAVVLFASALELKARRGDRSAWAWLVRHGDKIFGPASVLVGMPARKGASA